jgi:RNA polymerase sigma-70 factor, ECF subfamily
MVKKPSGPALENEKEIVERARKGDKEAYRLLVEAYKDRLFGLISTMISNREQAEDVSQEVFVKAFFALPRFEGGSAFYTWLFRIASNHCLDHLRKKRVSEVSLDATREEDDGTSRMDRLQAPETEMPEAMIGTPTESGEVLFVLPPEQRLILTLRELEGYSYEELADVMKCGVNTIKSRLNRAREALKQAFYQRYGHPSAPSNSGGKRGLK